MTASDRSVPADAPGAEPANARQRYVVGRADLPLSCPLPEMALWNSHPRVFLPIEAEREVQCPYCGAHFVLEE
ncbi:zinc-finger domain-containing protein [Lysobacter humi (ex Lee et al. 2017)]